MGYAKFVGSGEELNYGFVTASSFANLPSGKPANTLGFITTTAVPHVFFQNGTVSGMVTGDVVVRQGVTSSYPFNIRRNGKLFLNITGAMQYNGTLWVPISVYVYTGIVWTLLSEIYYDNGVIPSTVNDFLAYKASGTTATITKNADNVQFSLSSASGWGYGQFAIDVTYVNTLWFRARVTAPSMFVGVAPAYNSVTGLVSANVTEISAYADYSIDVAAVTGLKYLVFGLNSSTTRNIYVNKIWGV